LPGVTAFFCRQTRNLRFIALWLLGKSVFSFQHWMKYELKTEN
jgi:hypothetical protein